MGETPPSAELGRLRFLVGSFRGEGLLRGGRVRVEKESVGTWEAGGHFLALRMVASYWIGERLADRHEAMVLVGRERDAFAAEAFTDSGGTVRYALALDGDALVFDDRPPHGSGAARARKTISPTAGGYLEQLDLESTSGAIETYARLEMRRA
jgi:hypothetical protein